MIDKQMYEVAVDMLTRMSTSNIDDEMLQVGLATTMLKAATEQNKSEATMFKCLGYAGLIIHRYEEQNNLAEAATQFPPTLVQ